jgi:Fe(3+) dicitrate transport protein
LITSLAFIIELTRHKNIKQEFGRSKYLYHIPGTLNNSMFKANTTMSTTSLNYFSPDIFIPTLTLNWKLIQQTKIKLTTSGVFGYRSSVQLDVFAIVPDNINPMKGQVIKHLNIMGMTVGVV